MIRFNRECPDWNTTDELGAGYGALALCAIVLMVDMAVVVNTVFIVIITVFRTVSLV
jgi:hypothetical protein